VADADAEWGKTLCKLDKVLLLLRSAKCPNNCVGGMIEHPAWGRIQAAPQIEVCLWCADRKKLLDDHR
jgi:hypothetical protein